MTLTYFMQGIFEGTAFELGYEPYQTLEKITICGKTYKDLTISGSVIKEVVFEEVIFENCTFFGSQIVNCLFLNCLFINCKFQFSTVKDCNFELTSWENCIWGKSSVKESELIASVNTNSFGFESDGLSMTRTFNLHDFLNMTA